MRKRYIVPVVMVALLLALAGCTRNPDAAKRKYVESGKKYMEEKKYDSAVIQFKKALQIDPRYSEGHYELGRPSWPSNIGPLPSKSSAWPPIKIPITSRHTLRSGPCGGRQGNTRKRKNTPAS